jgi:hypothetical protein
MSTYTEDYDQVLKYSAGKHGTPTWNPKPHPDADPEQVAKRDSDPLWEYHRGIRAYGGHRFADSRNPSRTKQVEGKATEHLPILGTQFMPSTPGRYSMTETEYGPDTLDLTHTVPTGFVNREQWLEGAKGERGADRLLTQNAHLDPGGVGGELDRFHAANNPRYVQLWGHQAGRRPWYDTIFPLQDLAEKAAPHDQYRLHAAQVLSGNRHALPPLVDLLKRRDNPAGWYSGWGHLARAMEQRTGDLPPEEVWRRSMAILKASAKHSSDPDTHEAVARGLDHTPHEFHQLNHFRDHMTEYGLEPYADAIRYELANVMPELRTVPRRKNSRL